MSQKALCITIVVTAFLVTLLANGCATVKKHPLVNALTTNLGPTVKDMVSVETTVNAHVLVLGAEATLRSEARTYGNTTDVRTDIRLPIDLLDLRRKP